ncbi:TPA: hypothetical protein ACH3X1_014951 [Trebouxia sp. C0004]
MDVKNISEGVLWVTQDLNSAEVTHTHPVMSAEARQRGHASTSGHHTHLKQRREWCSTAHMLRNQQHAVENTLRLPMEPLRDGRQTQLDINQQASERRLLASALAARTDKIKQTVESIVNKLDNPQPGSHFVESIAAGLDAGEIQITELKAEQRQKYDALTKEEHYLTRQLELMLERMESPAWSLAPQADQPYVTHSVAARVPAAYQPKHGGGLLPEVEAFQDFHEQHGPMGGWHPDDHSEFERYLKACKGDYSHATLMCYDQMIGFKRADIISHARWHAEHQELYVKKRIALAEWRNQKEAQKAALAVQASFEVPTAHQAHQHRQLHQEQQRISRDMRQKSLADWKEAKDQEELEAAERRAERQVLQKQAELAAFAERQAANKLKLEEYHQLKAQQDAEAAAEAAAADRGSAVKLSAEQLQRLKERNHMFMQRRTEAAFVKQREQEERAAQLETLKVQVSAKVNAKVQKDPQRILKATAAAQQRLTAEQEDCHGSKPSGFIRNVSSKAVPAWRQPLKGMQLHRKKAKELGLQNSEYITYPSWSAQRPTQQLCRKPEEAQPMSDLCQAILQACRAAGSSEEVTVVCLVKTSQWAYAQCFALADLIPWQAYQRVLFYLAVPGLENAAHGWVDSYAGGSNRQLLVDFAPRLLHVLAHLKQHGKSHPWHQSPYLRPWDQLVNWPVLQLTEHYAYATPAAGGQDSLASALCCQQADCYAHTAAADQEQAEPHAESGADLAWHTSASPLDASLEWATSLSKSPGMQGPERADVAMSNAEEGFEFGGTAWLDGNSAARTSHATAPLQQQHETVHCMELNQADTDPLSGLKCHSLKAAVLPALHNQ